MPSSKSPLTSMSISWPIDAMPKASDAIVMRSTPVRPREASTGSRETSVMIPLKPAVTELKGKTHEHLGLFL